MSKRAGIVIGMGLGALWAVFVVWFPQTRPQPFLPLNTVIMGATFPLGLVLIAMIGRLAAARFFSDELIDGDDFATSSAPEIDARVLANTVEQTLLAVLIWPFVALTLGGLTVLWMAAGFVVARLAFWFGYRVSPPLRAFGFAATFYPTVLAALWTLLRWTI